MTTTMGKHRLDQLVMERGLAESRERAQALILAGQVMVNGQKSSKPGHSIADDARIEVLERMPYVSRGGYQTRRSARSFFDRGRRVGLASTSAHRPEGSPTVCFSEGLRSVWAIDVGHGQFDWKLRNDPRVVVQEGVNARYLDAQGFSDQVRLRRVRCELHIRPPA